ncbi:MAG: hypothetical protein ACRDK7_06890 [Solirubrobacteraceae bacterium]
MAAGTLASDTAKSLGVGLRRARGARLALAPWAVALVVAVPLAVVYLIAHPPSGDLAAATYRSELFSRVGLTLWDNGWYGGHYLLGYSLFSPARGALVGERLLLVLSVVTAAGLFGLLIERVFSVKGARAAAVSFAFGLSVELLSGRVAYDIGVAVGLLALFALQRQRTAAALACALLTSLASPVAGAFLALAGLAYALAGDDRRWRGVALAAAALTPILVLAVVFTEGGWEPFSISAFWPGEVGVILLALLLGRMAGAPRATRMPSPRTLRTLTWGAWCYVAVMAGSYVLHTPVGSNSVRLGELLAAPLVVGLLWEHRRVALALLAPLLLCWQVETSLNDLVSVAGEASVNESYYAPLLSELHARADGMPLRVEVPTLGAHWESVYLPEHGPVLLARGWERQLDARYAPLFYGPRLTPDAYKAWLSENGVSYVALTDGRLDFSSAAEGRLVARGLPYLREVWSSAHWRLYAVRDATPLAQRPAKLTSVGADSFTLSAPRPGSYSVKVRFTPYWAIEQGHGCVGGAPGGWTEVDARHAGTIRIGIDFSLARVFDHAPRCHA